MKRSFASLRMTRLPGTRPASMLAGSIRVAAAIFIAALTHADADEPAGLPIRLAPAAGQPIEAMLLKIDMEHGVSYLHEGRTVEMPLADVCGIIPLGRRDLPGASALPGKSALDCTLHLPDEGLITARLLTSTEGADIAGGLLIDLGLNKPIMVPFTKLAGIRLASEPQAEGQRELEARLAKRDATRDLMIVVRRGKPTVLPGALEKLTPRGWEFTAAGQTHKGTCDQVYAIVLGVGPTTPRQGPATVHLADGGRLTGRVTSADPRALQLESEWLGRLTIPWHRIRSVLLLSERIVYLSDTTQIQTDVNTLLDAPWPPQRDANIVGGTLRVGGIAYAKGLGVHANAKVTYALDGAFEQFLAECGVDDAVAPHGSVVFRVLADGKQVFESPIVRPGRKPLDVTVDMTGVSKLTLEVADGGDMDLSDHADWANARLVRKKSDGKRPGEIGK